MDQGSWIRKQIVLIFGLLFLWGCSGSAKVYDLGTLPSHWRNYCWWGGHAQSGELSSSELPWSISYDRRWMGSREITVNPLADLSYEEKMVDGELARILLKRKDYLIVSFPNSMQSFFAKVNEEHKIDYVKELLFRYRYDLLSVEYLRGTDCFLPSEHSYPDENLIAYYECLTLAKPDEIYYLTSLGYAYLQSLLKGERRWWTYEFQGGSEFQVLSKVDSVANLLQGTEKAHDGARMRAAAIHLIADYTLREKNLEAALSYLDGQLSKHAADTLLTPRLHQERQKLIHYTQEVKEGKYVDRSRINW